MHDIGIIGNTNSPELGLPKHFFDYTEQLPEELSIKHKLHSLVNQQNYFFDISVLGNEVKTYTKDNLLLTLDLAGEKKTRALYKVTSFLQKIQTRFSNLSAEQEHKLISAFLLTQDGFGNTMRKTGGPAFEHILAVVEKTLQLSHCTFDQVLIALLHDNIEDLPELDLTEYRYLFGKRIVDKVLELSHKPWYHRIGFLPQEQRLQLHSIIGDFIENPENNCSEKTKKFLVKLGTLSEDNLYEGLDIFFDTMDPKDSDNLRHYLRNHNDQNIRDMIHFCEEVSGYRFFAKKLSDDILPIKFADRIHNTENLFSNLLMSIRSLLETDSYFLGKGNKDTTHVYDRIHKHPIIRDYGEEKTHYEILSTLVDTEKEKIKKKISNTDQALFDFDKWYDQAYLLYAKKVELFKNIEKDRNNILQQGGEDQWDKEDKLDTLYTMYLTLNKKFEAHLSEFPCDVRS